MWSLNSLFVTLILLVLSSWIASDVYAQDSPLKIEKLSSRINSANYDETNPVVSRDGSTLYFTRVGHPGFKRTLIQDGLDLSARMNAGDYQELLQEVYEEIAAEAGHDPNSSPFNQDIWIAESRVSEFDDLIHPEHPVNNALPNSVCSLSPNPEELIIVNEFYADGSMYKGFSIIAKDKEGNWLAPKPMYIYEMDEYGSDVNLNMSHDGEILILSINRVDTYGDNDLYVSFKVSDNKWSAPRNMGPTLNTKHREATPFISKDLKTLYFASNRPGGLGGMDIYISKRLDPTWKRWTTPELLESPINSSFNDAQPFLCEKTGSLYFSSVREGDSNIYRAKEEDIIDRIKWEELVPDSTIVDVPQQDYPQLPDASVGDIKRSEENSFVSEEKIAPLEKTLESFTIHCSLVDSKTGRLVEGNVGFGLASEDLPASKLRAKGGEVSFNVKASSLVRITPEISGYIAQDKYIHPLHQLEKGINEQNFIFYVDPMVENTVLTLNPIYFERSKAEVIPTSFSELDNLVRTLMKYPNVNILIGGHTDHVGKLDELIQLSQERADAIRDYFVKNGMEPSRIRTKGYGPTRPIIQGNDESSRSKNRRVEIRIDKIL